PGASTDFSCTFTAIVSGTWTATGHGTDALGNPVSLAGETTGGGYVVIHPSTFLTTFSVTPGTTVLAGTPVTITRTDTNTGDSTIAGASATGPNSGPTLTGAASTRAAGASTTFSCPFPPAASVTWTATGHGTDSLGIAVPTTNETTSGTITVAQPSNVCSLTW